MASRTHPVLRSDLNPIADRVSYRMSEHGFS